VGQSLWHHLLEDAALGGKAQAVVIKRLPLTTRRKSTLELLAKFLRTQPGDIAIHTLDLDLLLVDHISPAAQAQHDASPICFVTQGLIRESLFWATGKNYDVDEIHCMAHGEHTCEFKITGG
jgi:predicted hydrocarbon binding protein